MLLEQALVFLCAELSAGEGRAAQCRKHNPFTAMINLRRRERLQGVRRGQAVDAAGALGRVIRARLAGERGQPALCWLTQLLCCV